MELGLSSFTYGWAVSQSQLSVGDLVDNALGFGLPRLQFGDNLPAENFSGDDIQVVRNSGLKVELGAKGLTYERAAFYLDLCRRLDATVLRFVIDRADFQPDESEVIDIIRTLLPGLERSGITLGIENHDRWPAKTYRHIIETVNHSRVGICLDTVNSLGAGEGLGHVVDVLAPFCVNLHVKDFVIRRQPDLMGFTIEGRPAGQGDLNISALLSSVTTHGRCLSGILELWTVPEMGIASTIAKEKIWAKESIGYLKPYFN